MMTGSWVRVELAGIENASKALSSWTAIAVGRFTPRA